MAYINGNEINFSATVLDENGYYTKGQTNTLLNAKADVSALDGKAGVDASNLTSENITSWQNKCGFERVETIYDKDSSDSNINWGYTSGLQSVTVTGKNFSKYKRLRIYYCNKNSSSTDYDTFGRNNIIELDLSKFFNFEYSAINMLRYGNYKLDYVGGIIVKINEDKTSFAVVMTDDVSASAYSFVYKIEGAY